MTRVNGRLDELTQLLEELCEDRLTPDSAARLERIVSADAEARRFYLDYLDLHGTLHWDTALGAEADPAEPLTDGLLPMTAVSRPSSRRRWAALTIASAALVIAVILAVRGRTPVEQVVQAPPRPPAPAAQLGADGKPDEPEPRPESPGGRRIVHLESHAPQPGGTPEPRDPQGAEAGSNEPDHSIVEAVPSVSGSAQSAVALIDQEIRVGWSARDLEPSPRASDAEWLRRVYLDVLGRIPTADDVERFLADDRPDKRTRLVDRLLEHPAYPRHMSTIWANLLVGRSMSRNVNRPALEKFLRMSFAENRAWSDVVSDLVAAEGDYEENGATNFLLAHLNSEAVPATAITSRVLLGIQVHCTQCHNHPFNDWKQEQFWQLNCFFKETESVPRFAYNPRSGRREHVTTELVSQPAGDDPIFFETRTGLMKAAYPAYEGLTVSLEGQEVNLREELARLMTYGAKPQIADALVNRLWEHFFGYGFTRVVDDMGPHTPASHPQLLDGLARAFVASGYDVKQLIRWICNSEPYQLSSRATPANSADAPAVGELPLFTRMYVKPMSAEQLYDSLLVATNAHQAGFDDWTDAARRRRRWLQQFVVAFDTEDNDEVTNFAGTISQSLMMMNGPLIEEALSGKPGTILGDVLRRESDENERIRRLWLAALSRHPTPRELAAVRRIVRDSPVRPGPRRAPAAYQDVFWAFLNSNEFIMIH